MPVDIKIFFWEIYIYRERDIHTHTVILLQFLLLSPLFCQTHACWNSNASTAKPMAFAFSHTLAPTSGTISPKASGTLLLSLLLKANSRHFSSQNISLKQHCPFTPIHSTFPSRCTLCVIISLFSTLSRIYKFPLLLCSWKWLCMNL